MSDEAQEAVEETKLSKKAEAKAKAEAAKEALQAEIEEFQADWPEFSDNYDAIYTKVYNKDDNAWDYPVPELPLLSRQAAIKMDMKKFYTGVPCKHDHDTPRKVKGGCMGCIRDRIKAKRAAKAEKARMEKEAAAPVEQAVKAA